MEGAPPAGAGWPGGAGSTDAEGETVEGAPLAGDAGIAGAAGVGSTDADRETVEGAPPAGAGAAAGATTADGAAGPVGGSDAEGGADAAEAGWRGVRVVARRATAGWLVACCAAACWAWRAAMPAFSLARSFWVSIGPTAATSSMRRIRATSPRRPPTMPPGVQVASLGTSRAARGRLRSGSRRMATGRADDSQAGVPPGASVVRRTAASPESGADAGDSG
ncbi:hypothetical protein GCM10023349_33490 [Nocardioides conyzicola]|uniref:Uncharacterized protein n=1 Tax=Nocardioides conyzicola TaxID=1651781 RepID=A0ABP8XRV7_9ACTN